MMDGYAVVIPAYNPMKELPDYIRNLLELGARCVIVVNDGSHQEYLPIFEELKNIDDCYVVSYVENQGKGYALKVGFQYLIDQEMDIVGVVTADADGQHNIHDVTNIGHHLLKTKVAFVLGVRDFREDHVPFRSWLGNRFATTMFYLFFQTFIRDTQTGLRGIKWTELGHLVTVPGERFDFEANMLIDMALRERPYAMVEIETLYADDHHSNFDTLSDTLRITKQGLKAAANKQKIRDNGWT